MLSYESNVSFLQTFNMVDKEKMFSCTKYNLFVSGWLSPFQAHNITYLECQSYADGKKPINVYVGECICMACMSFLYKELHLFNYSEVRARIEARYSKLRYYIEILCPSCAKILKLSLNDVCTGFCQIFQSLLRICVFQSFRSCFMCKLLQIALHGRPLLTQFLPGKKIGMV